MVIPPALCVGIDPATTGTNGLATTGCGEPILGVAHGIEHAMGCPQLDEILERLASLAEPVTLAVGIEYPRFNNRRGGGAYTVRAAANAWERIIREKFPHGTPGLKKLRVFHIDPPVWQRAVLGDAWKDLGTKQVSLMVAKSILGVDTYDHNLADAVCIAYFTKSLHLQEQMCRSRIVKHERKKRKPRGKATPHQMTGRIKHRERHHTDEDPDID